VTLTWSIFDIPSLSREVDKTLPTFVIGFAVIQYSTSNYVTPSKIETTAGLPYSNSAVRAWALCPFGVSYSPCEELPCQAFTHAIAASQAVGLELILKPAYGGNW